MTPTYWRHLRTYILNLVTKKSEDVPFCRCWFREVALVSQMSKKQMLNWVVVSKIFYVHPKIGEMIQFDLRIFFRWVVQPSIIHFIFGVFHYFHHPFWGVGGFPPIFGSTPKCPKNHAEKLDFFSLPQEDLKNLYINPELLGSMRWDPEKSGCLMRVFCNES